MISKTLHPTSYTPKQKVFYFFPCVCNREEKYLFMVKVLGCEFMVWKRERRVLLLGECKIKNLGFSPQGLGREKNMRESCFFSFLFLHPHLLQMIIFNLQKGFRGLKKRSRIVKKKIFMRASTPEKTSDQIEASNGFFIGAECMCRYKQPARISFTISLSSGDHRPM